MPLMFSFLMLAFVLGCSCSTKTYLQPSIITGQGTGDRSCPSNMVQIRENVTKNVHYLLQLAFISTNVYRDCKAAFEAGQVNSGVYTVSPNNSNVFEVSE